ncbi:MAG TPA: glycosyltransferase family 2 protein [Anaerolineales bacterium]|nr:glycosyltransferase family 2 protein [Anaerolineales bacterium]
MDPRIIVSLFFWLSVLFVVYTYIGYPILIGILARAKPQSIKYSNLEPSITLLITAYNEEAVIYNKIENSLALEYPKNKLQILIAADGSTDGTQEIVRKFSDQAVELSFSPERAGKIVAMNRAVLKARGEIIVFSDANNMYEPGALRELLAPFSDKNVGATTGAKMIIQDGSDLGSAEGIYWKYESWIKKNETAFSSCIGAVGEMLAVRRDLYVPPPKHVINDDYFIVLELLKRGYRVSYVPEARSFENVSVRESDEIIRRSRMTTGKYQAIFGFFNLLPFGRPVLLWQIVSHKYFRAFLPFGFIGAFLANILLIILPPQADSFPTVALIHPYDWLLMISQLVFYGAAFLPGEKRAGGMLGKVLYIPAYLVNSNIAVLKGLYGFLTRKQTNIWERVRRGNL